LTGAASIADDISLVNAAGVTLALLAGGRGARMGGPKSGLAIRGMPILRYLADRWRWPGPTLLVTAPGNERPAAADAFAREVTDAVADEGPLRGVLTAAEQATTDVVACVTVDMPRIGRERLEWLIDRLAPSDVAVLCSRRTAQGGRVEPFPLVIRAGARHQIAARLASGRRAVYAITEEAGVRVVLAPPEWPDSVWTNLNRPEELEAFVRAGDA
jgi:molybdopterin-guanine dinucleotide biosynthesis protein A